MKIAVIAPSQVPSSTANSIQVMKVCQAFVRLGHDVRLWLPGDCAVPWQELADLYGVDTPFDIFWLPSSLRLKRYDLAWKAMQNAAAWNADMVYTWMLQASLLSLWRRLPVLLEMHMLPSGNLGPLLFKSIVNNPHKKRILFITAALQHRLEETYRFKLLPEESIIAPMGSEPERFENLPQTAGEARKSLQLNEQITVAYAGHFYPGRGIEMLFSLATSLPHIQFLWIGGREQDIQYWKERLQSGGLSNVLMTGFIENRNLPKYLAAADILLMPYAARVGVSSCGDTAEVCSPMKMFDYLSAGRAIISSDLPVLHEVLNESNAVFCPPDDENAWKQALITLTQDRETRLRLAAQARLDSHLYTWDTRARQSILNFP